MNIIKFKDKINPQDMGYNTFLKGKYAYWVNMRWVIPFDFISTTEYSQIESGQRGVNGVPGKDYWDSFDEDLMAYIDASATELANTIVPFQRHNKYTTDSDLTIEDIKRFRTWLAETLLTFDQDNSGKQLLTFYDDEVTHMLQYYAGGMYDETTKWVSKFSTVESILTSGKATGYGCCNKPVLSGLNESIHVCDPLSMYQENLYKKMVLTFGSIDFWDDMSNTFLEEFKKYIDNIIRLNLPLVRGRYVSVLSDCSCLQVDEQKTAQDILRRLSQALTYLIDRDTTGNKNYISTAFIDWSQNLYEQMEWN